jgi:sugar lactone lactonase YvrE
MFEGNPLKVITVITLFFFGCCFISSDYVFAVEENSLAKAKRLYETGDYEGAVKTLEDLIEKIKKIVAQKKVVADAYYLMAIIYYEIGDDEKAEANLRNVFETYPKFSIDESNVDFRAKVETMKLEVEKKKKEEAQMRQEEERKREEEARKKEEEMKRQEALRKKAEEKKKDELKAKKVIEKPTLKKKKKTSPLLLVLGGAAVIVLAVMLLGKKKGSTIQPPSPQEPEPQDPTVHLESTPAGAVVYSDQQVISSSTPADFTLTPGEHEIWLKLQNFGEAKRTINFQQDTTYNITVRLSGYTYEFVISWGSSGGSNGLFRNPGGIALDSQGYIYVADSENHRIQKFDANGNFISSLNKLWLPWDVAIDSHNDIFVVEHDKVKRFNANGDLVTKWGNRIQFKSPTHIAVDGSDNVYVSDFGNSRVQKFDRNGNFIIMWGSYGVGDGQFVDPVGIAADKDNYIYVGDQANDRIQKFDANGNFVINWGSEGDKNGQFYFLWGVSVDNNGYIYSTDLDNQRIQKFDSSGNFITKWGSGGTTFGQFLQPTGVAVDRNGFVYVVDSGNNRIQKFRMSDTQTDNDGEWDINSTPASKAVLGASKGHRNLSPHQKSLRIEKRTEREKDKEKIINKQ